MSSHPDRADSAGIAMTSHDRKRTAGDRRELGPGTGHDERVARYSELLAHLAGLDRRRCREIRIASRLHDIGKVTTPAAILSNPGPLDDGERERMKEHAEVGYRLLFSPGDRLMMLAATIALTHHERHDGSGYPRGLRGELIPLEGRIVAICDVFDALTSDRVYRPALALDAALEIMRGGRGTQFDPALLDLLLADPARFVAIGNGWRGLAATRLAFCA